MGRMLVMFPFGPIRNFWRLKSWSWFQNVGEWDHLSSSMSREWDKKIKAHE